MDNNIISACDKNFVKVDLHWLTADNFESDDASHKPEACDLKFEFRFSLLASFSL